ncbi:threonine ammonia-lyase IlvA [Candidatus Woesearchaeota archaeon]|nr:threonine ammonia-lyase IlvA [Candidatus Woesearchaeota archaeon]
MKLTLDTILKTKERIESVVRKTPLEFNEELSKKYDCEVYLKREDLQQVRSYKIRGAYALLSSLTDAEKEKGVVCASAGNHAQGVAHSCNLLGIHGTIFMPRTTPYQKIARTRHFGNEQLSIHIDGDSFDSTYEEAMRYCNEHDKLFVHPFDDERVIAGQASVGLEIVEHCPHFDYVFVPVGGGGLVAGMISAVGSHGKVIGVEASGSACMKAALAAGHPVDLQSVDRFADGVAVRKAGARCFAIAQEYNLDIVTVDDGALACIVLDLYQEHGIIAEPAGALSIAALGQYPVKGRKVVCILSGGNNDVNRYPEITERALLYKGLKHYFIIDFPQRPGALREFLDGVLGPTDDITLFEYMKKTNKETGPALVGIELAAARDYEGLVARMRGIQFRELKEDDLMMRYVV